MKNLQIEFEGEIRNLKYKNTHKISNRCIHTFTYFYEGFETIIEKSWLFGRKEKIIPKFIFVVYIDIEDAKHSKETIRTAIFSELKNLKRVEEIKRGEII